MDLNLNGDTKWIKPILESKWPNIVTNKGIDLNSDGEIKDKELIPDYNQNDKLPIGEANDYWMFLEYNKSEIASKLEFINSAKNISFDNPIHSVLANNQENSDKIYETLAAIVTKINNASENKLGILTDKSEYSELIALLKDKTSESKLGVSIEDFLMICVGDELNITPFSTVYNKGLQLYAQENYQEAIVSFDSAKTLTDNPEYLKSCQDNIGKSVYILGKNSMDAMNYEKALAYFDQSTKNLQDDNNIARAYYRKGLCETKLELLDNSLESFDKATELSADAKDKAWAYFSKGNALVILKNEKSAINSFLQAASYFLEINESVNTKAADSFHNAANSYNNLKDFSNAIAYYQKATSLYDTQNKIDDCNNSIAIIKYNQANSSIKNNNNEEAIPLYKEALKLFTDVNNKNLASNNIARIHYNNALETYNDSINPTNSAKMRIALDYCNKALEYAIDEDLQTRIREALDTITTTLTEVK